MNIDQLILKAVATGVKFNGQHHTVLRSMYDQMTRGKSMTAKQVSYAQSILKSYIAILSQKFGSGVEDCIKNPTTMAPMRESAEISAKTISMSANGEFFNVQFAYDADIVSKIREYRSSSEARSPGDISWVAPNWVIRVTSKHATFVTRTLIPLGFTTDAGSKEILSRVDDVITNFDKYTPYLDYEDGSYIIRNAPRFMPLITYKTVIPAAFQAKSYGVLTWSDIVDSQISMSGIYQITHRVLTGAGSVIRLEYGDKEEHLAEALKLHEKILVVVGSWHQGSTTRTMLRVLELANIQASQVAVLFRMPNDTNREFNEFVKEAGLNNKIGDDTRVVILDEKLPKQLADLDTRFDIVLTYGHTISNKALRDFVNRQPQIVNFQNKNNEIL